MLAVVLKDFNQLVLENVPDPEPALSDIHKAVPVMGQPERNKVVIHA